MKKYILGILLALAIVVTPAFLPAVAGAQTASPALIAQLQAQLAQLQAQLQKLIAARQATGLAVSGFNLFIIKSIDGPTTLKVGENGQWTVNVGDPTKGALTYQVAWGDEAAGSNQRETLVAGSAIPAAARQTVTFNHTFHAAGSYPIQFSVTSGTNQAQNGILVNVK